MVEERSLKVYSKDTTFFNKISTTLTKILIPTKIGINSMMINIKRSAVIKAYEQIKAAEENGGTDKMEALKGKYDDGYTLYLESIDKNIMDSIYKKVKNDTASLFERNALSDYYNVVHLKDKEYLEYKYRKQKFLLELDYETLKAVKKEKIISKFMPVYLEKMDIIYKGILKNYSVKLADGLKATRVNQVDVYKNIFSTLEDYIKNVLPIKLDTDEGKKFEKIVKDYEDYEAFSVGKLDEREFLEKNMILLGLSRVLFTHSLPLVAAEQCYNKLLRDTRSLIVKTKNEEKKEYAYQMLLKLIEDYNVKLLSTKVYWDKIEEREAYKKFWDAYSKADSYDEKEVLSLKRELHDTALEYEKYADIRQFYKDKLCELGAMRRIKGNSCRSLSGHYTKL
ncbi:MAG: hypothetical protein K6D97_02960 [Clostridia bacterium]|nr:hypothetical protein [Clostridia bacterium]